MWWREQIDKQFWGTGIGSVIGKSQDEEGEEKKKNTWMDFVGDVGRGKLGTEVETQIKILN
jgi:hypothetical protein